jgi:uncharacterized protein
VIDVSTLVGAVPRPASLPRRAFELIVDRYELFVSRMILDELTDVMLRPKFDRYVVRQDRAEFVQRLTREAVMIEIAQEIAACRDPDDDKYRSLAVSAEADVIVSSDADLLALDPFRGIRILSPRDFLDRSLRWDDVKPEIARRSEP